jgi:multimeric flavodoxin WrbA
MTKPAVRKETQFVPLTRAAFRRRFFERFFDPAFDDVQPELEKICERAWDGYINYRKAPRTQPAGPGFADPTYKISIDWLKTRQAIRKAEEQQRNPSSASRMPLCHWPCSCYPNHSLNQVHDWMNEIYERWVAAHAVVIVTPTHWYSTSSALKLMIDRLVCADGGNPDPTSTHGKKPDEAMALELKGWDYPKHLARRVYGLVVHGDVAGIEGSRRALSDWLDWMGLVDAGPQARLDRFIGYYEPYATSHDELDGDADLQEEVRNVARAVARVAQALRRGELQAEVAPLSRPRPK